jgi:hypothetical protein
MAAIDSIFHKATLLTDLEANAYMDVVTSGYIESLTGKLPQDSAHPTLPSPHALPPSLRTGAAFLAAMAGWVRTSESFYISPDMMDVVFAAATALENCDDVAIEADTPPTPIGWLWLPVPLTILDIRSKIIRLHGCVWAVFGGCVQVVWLTDKYDPVDSVNQHLREDEALFPLLPRFTVAAVQRVPLGRPLRKTKRLTTPDGGGVPPSLPITVTKDEGRTVLFFPKGYGPDEVTTVDAPALDMLFLYAFWTMMQQKIAARREEPLPRQARRLMRQVNLSDAPITVIEFRRASINAGGGAGVEWSHRFLRRGTWRWQWYGSEKDGSRRQERIWIHPTIVNAHRTDLPFLVRDHVNALLK